MIPVPCVFSIQVVAISRACKASGSRSLRGSTLYTSCEPFAMCVSIQVVAISRACKASGSRSLSGCTLYASCEPCAMCASLIWWANIDHVYYSTTGPFHMCCCICVCLGFVFGVIQCHVCQPLWLANLDHIYYSTTGQLVLGVGQDHYFAPEIPVY